MKQSSYAEFSEKIHDLSPGKRLPIGSSLELTYRCNNRCIHCFCNLPANDPAAKGRELTTAEVKGLLDGLAEMGTLWLLITGGEPLLREDFEEIYRYAKAKGFIVTLFTNGTLLDDRALTLLKRYRPFVVEISLYGATREVYEKVTGVAGSFDLCMRGIRRVVDAGLQLKLKSMALRANQHEIAAMDRLAQDLGCSFHFDTMVQKRIDEKGFPSPEDCRLSAKDVVRLDLSFPRRLAAYREFCEHNIRKPRAAGSLYRCGAGRRMLHVNPYGEAMGCMMMVRDGFSLREHSLSWVWEEGIVSVIDRQKSFSQPCDDCELKNLCGQCTAWSILETGDEKKELTYLCEVANERARSFEFINR